MAGSFTNEGIIISTEGNGNSNSSSFVSGYVGGSGYGGVGGVGVVRGVALPAVSMLPADRDEKRILLGKLGRERSELKAELKVAI